MVGTRQEFTLVALVLGAALLSGCPPPTVIVDGQKVTLPEASRRTYEAARTAEQAGRREEAVAGFRGLLHDYPRAEQVPDALAALGALLTESGQHAEAAECYQRLVADFPSSPHYLKAAVGLGLALVKLGRTAEALPTLQSVFDQLPDDRRKHEVATMLAASYEEARAPLEALRWYAAAWRHAGAEPAREALRQRIEALIDTRLGFVEVRTAYETLREIDPRSFPLDLLQLKLAKIFYHIHDFGRSRSALEAFVAGWPQHPLAGVAGEMLKRILDRDRVNPLAIGVLLPLTGSYRDYGHKALAGIQLGAGIFEELPEGAVAPVLVIRDTTGTPEEAARQMEDLVFHEHVVAVIGPMFSGEAHAAAVKAEELEVPILTLSARTDLPSLGRYVFRNFLTLEAQARLLVGYTMEKLGVRRFALLYPNDKYGVGFVNAFWDEIARRQGEVRAAERYEPDSKNFAAPVKKLVGRYWLEARWDFVQERRKVREQYDNSLARKRAMEKLLKKLPPVVDFEAIFVPDYVEKVVLIAPALAFEDIVLKTESQWQIDRLKKSLGRDKLDMVYLLGGNGWNDPKVVEWAGRYVQGTLFTDGFFSRSTRPATAQFTAKFKASFDREPDMIEAHAYDCARILRNLVETKRPATRPLMRQTLADVRDFDGATGRTSFDPDGDAQKELFLLTVKKEEIVEVPPEPATSGS